MANLNHMEFIIENWAELMLAALAFAKVIVNLLPTESPAHGVFEYIDRIITAITGDNRKSRQNNL